MTFNGNFGGDGAGYATGRENGTVVHQMFFNTQFETFGGDGWLRVVEFLEDGTTVRVRTFSPFHDMVRTHSEFQFEFQISPLALPPVLAGDYNGDGTVSAADIVLWRRTTGSTVELAADGNRNGIVDQDDYDIWRRNFGAIQFEMGHSTVAVPEPYAVVPALLTTSFIVGVGGVGLRRRKAFQFN
jgi:hypothetical protein